MMGGITFLVEQFCELGWPSVSQIDCVPSDEAEGTISVHCHLADETLNGGLPVICNLAGDADAVRKHVETTIYAGRALHAYLKH